MGYVPDAAMKALCAYRDSNRLQEIRSGLAYLTDMDKTNSFGEMVFQKAKAQAASMGYNLQKFNLNKPGASLDHFRSIWWKTGIKGVLIGPFTDITELDDKWDEFVVVAYGYSVISPKFHRAEFDHFGNLLAHLKILRNRGYKRIGLCLDEGLDVRTHGLLHGAYLLEQIRSKASKIALIDFASITLEELWKTIKKERLDAVICLPEQYEYILSLGIKIPEDIGVSLLSWKRYEKNNPMQCAGFNSHAEELTTNTVSFLVSLLHKHAYGLSEEPLHLMISGNFHDGETIRQSPDSLTA